MRTIKIDTEYDGFELYPDDWKGYVYGPEEEFDEVFVIKPGDRYTEINSASWYQKALEYMEENDINETEGNVLSTLRKLFPDDKFDSFAICGCVQGEYADVIYKANAFADECNIKELRDCLGDFYFGYVTEIYDEEENCVIYVSNSEFWEVENEGNIEKYIRELIGIDDDEEVRIMKSNGYTMVKNWERIN